MVRHLFAQLAALAVTSIVAAEPPFVFVDVSTERGLLPYEMSLGMGGGVAAADYDNDGDVDFFVPNAEGKPDQLYRNLGDGTFEEIAAALGLASLEEGRVALWLDADGDGRLDLLVCNDFQSAESSYRFYRQDPIGVFADVTRTSGLLVPMPPPIDPTVVPHRGGVCAGDLNGDGYLDLYSAQWNGDPHLFVNDGDGTFTEIASASGVTEAFHYAHQPMMLDFDLDGRLDLYVAIDFLWNALFLNQGDLAFIDAAPAAGADNAMNDMGMALADIDNDGDLDVYITNIFSPGAHNILLRNDTTPGVPAFIEIAEDLAIDDGGWGWGTTLFDADNDGWLDVAATNGWVTPMFAHDRSRLFRNTMGETDPPGGPAPFEDVSEASGFDDDDWGSSLIAADFDRDGDLDLLQTCNPTPLRLLENRRSGAAAGNDHLVIRPRMRGPNRFAIGAIVRVSAGDLAMMRLITAGSSYLGQEPAEAWFGLGAEPVAERVTIEWPNGATSCLSDVPAGGVIDVLYDAPAGGTGDVTDDGLVNGEDLREIIASWGDCPSWPDPCRADVTADCVVGVADLIEVILHWE